MLLDAQSPSFSRLNKLLSLNFFTQGKCSCPDQLGDPLLSLLQLSYIFLALWDPALDAVSCCGLIITSLDLPLELNLFKQFRTLLAFIPSRAHSSYSAYRGLSFNKLIGFKKTLRPTERNTSSVFSWISSLNYFSFRFPPLGSFGSELFLRNQLEKRWPAGP